MLCKINYETFTSSTYRDNREIIIPSKSNMQDKLILPPNSVYLIQKKVDEDGIIINKEIAQATWLGSLITTSKGNCHIKIMNATDKLVLIPHSTIKTKSLKKL